MKTKHDFLQASKAFNGNAWTPKEKSVLLYVVEDARILLIHKHRGLGKGKINAPGGKLEAGESFQQAAIRETKEEVGIIPRQVEKIGELWFSMSDVDDILTVVYRAESFEGKLIATPEATPFWISIHDLPYDQMWEDDRYWLPSLIEKTSFLGRFIFEEDRLQKKDLNFGIDFDSEGWESLS